MIFDKLAPRAFILKKKGCSGKDKPFLHINYWIQAFFLGVEMQFAKGDLVKNTKAPGWGIGEVRNISSDYVKVIFENVDGSKDFDWDDNPLKKVDSLKGVTKLKRKLKAKIYGGKSTEERVQRDKKNAQAAKSFAEKDLANFSKATFKSDITGHLSDFSRVFDADGAHRYANLQAISKNPFHAMVEVITTIGNEDDQIDEAQLWYLTAI